MKNRARRREKERLSALNNIHLLYKTYRSQRRKERGTEKREET